MSEEKQKICTCEEPLVKMSIPEGFAGTVRCARCQGIAEFPRKKSEYIGNDPVEGYLFALNANSPGMTMEKAFLTMMLRIETILTAAAQKKDPEKKVK